MKNYKYEKVDMRSRSLFSLQTLFENNLLYWSTCEAGDYVVIDSEYDFATLAAENNIYIRKEKSWWEGCVGSVIMVRDSDSEEWKADILKQKSEFCFICAIGDWNQARPLTATERDSIKTQG